MEGAVQYKIKTEKMSTEALWHTCMQESEAQKDKFKAVVAYINDNNIELNKEQRDAIQSLIAAWNKKDKNIDDYFDMKAHHSVITGADLSKDFTELWMDYLSIGLKMRVKMMQLALRM